MKKGLTLLLLVLTLILAACTNQQPSSQEEEPEETSEETAAEETAEAAEETSPEQTSQGSDAEIPAAVDQPLKIAAIMEFSTGTFASQYVSGLEAQVKKFGGEVQIYNANNDLSQMANHLQTAINQGVDGILIDHGRAEALNQGVEEALEKGIPVVTFDNDITADGVTAISQDDYSLAWGTLKQLAQDIDGEGNIVYVWAGGFTPLERRNVIYEAFLEHYPNIEEVARFGSVSNNTALDSQNQMEAVLKKYPEEGSIDAVFAPYDEFAKGVTRAIQQAGRDEIKVYGIDLSDEDLQIMQAENSPWVTTAATDPAEVAGVQVRFLYQKIAGEETPSIYALDPSVVNVSDLPDEPVTMADVGQHIEGWGSPNAARSPWMDALEAKNAQ
ncbi:protein: sugar ABC-type transporter, substrate-binding protein/ transcriptional regulator, lacI family [Jeotgalibacillus alimentarius]|uniref:Protein: sugar ABC-type transporter, substrate-binding protein/ transcriptional regulator, lacI family n=1 Tax=Jeotgalibacillus alimentarius TaxID=135826 RepID=A0A0C2QZK0_9BACL|nr:sugar ABC transporter substrate-binding protein [Jeotgalibacillus alimentarius]KIL43485.1 protein: sugar ABC-type transporter, substrate-binding protein/ transcriptional regulator, lacI family [Jeotgalibacillus alimentarius]